MLRRLIENWWTNTTERTFQQPFAALCQLRGETVLHVTRHCAMELGKDVITRSPGGQINTYQLKTCAGSRLTLSQWQSDISPQLADLVEGPVTHASVGTVLDHQPWIVVNGDIDEEVTRAIGDRNKRYMAAFGREIKVRVIGELVSDSQLDATAIWPQDPEIVRALFETSLSNGRQSADKNKLSSLLSYLVELPDTTAMSEVVRNATFAPLLVSLATMRHSQEGNWFALVEAWVLCRAYVNAAKIKHGIPERKLSRTFSLLEQLIYRSIESLQEDVANNPSLLVTPFDYAFELVRYRATIVIGLLCILALKKRSQGDGDEELESLIDELLANLKAHPVMWGESAVPYLLAIYFYQRGRYADQRCVSLLAGIVNELARLNSPGREKRLPSAYLTVDEALKEQIVGQDAQAKNAGGFSMWLKPTVELLAKEGYRQTLARAWFEITEVDAMEFVPKHDWQRFTWRTEQGATITTPFTDRQSWQSLLASINEVDQSCVGQPYEQQPVDWLLFLAIFPHRASSQILRGIDCGLWKLSR